MIGNDCNPGLPISQSLNLSISQSPIAIRSFAHSLIRMINNRTYYAILQVDPSASHEVITSSYKRLSGLYQSGSSEGGDARPRLRDLREAHAVLSSPYARMAYDARLRRRAALFELPEDEVVIDTSIDFSIRVPVEPRQGVLLTDRHPKQEEKTPVAWLAYLRRRGGDFTFKIDRAMNLHLVISSLRTQVPEDRRRYDPTSQEWQVAAEFESVLQGIFLNYDSLAASEQIAPTQVGYPNLKPVDFRPDPVPLPPRKEYTQTVSRPVTYSNRINWPPILIAVLGAALLYNLFLLVGGNTLNAVVPTPTLDLLALRPTPARLPTRTPTPVVVLVEPQYLTVNLRSGPGESYDSLRYLYQGTNYQAIGRNDDASWVLVQVREGPTPVPPVDPPAQSQLLATPTPFLPPIVATGWIAAWTLTLKEGIDLLPIVSVPEP